MQLVTMKTQAKGVEYIKRKSIDSLMQSKKHCGELKNFLQKYFIRKFSALECKKRILGNRGHVCVLIHTNLHMHIDRCRTI